jgi:hypothetical protein
MSRKTSGPLVLLSLLVALFAFPAFAQAVPGSVVGTVTAGGSVIAGVDVTLQEWYFDSFNSYYYWSNYDGTVSDAAGRFEFSGVDEGTDYRVVAKDRILYKYYPAYSSRFTLDSDETESVSVVLPLDSDVPRVDFERDGVRPKNYTNEVADARLFASDHYHDVDDNCIGSMESILYAVNGGPSVLTTQPAGDYDMRVRVPAFTIDGVSVITYSARDSAGNTSKTGSALVYIDKTAPVTAYDRKAATGSGIVLSATDAGSGVAATFWRIGGTGAFTQGNWVPVPASGVATLEFYSVDEVGNLEAVKSMTIQSRASLTKPKVSTTAPRANRTFYVRGAVLGKTAATGTLRVYKLVNGKYKYVSKKSFKESSAGTYRVAFKLKKGTYKFKAFYGANTATASNPPVTSVYSARSIVK